MTEGLLKGAYMSVAALLTNQRSNARYNAQPKSSLKSKNQELSWETNFESELLGFSKEENINKNIARRLDNPVLNSCYISPVIRTEEPVSDCPENVRNYTKGTYSGSRPGELGPVFYTYYSPECIKCVREGERNPNNPDEKIGEDKFQWEIKLDSKEQYDKIMKFLSNFSQEDNFRFAVREIFWNDFLEDKIDMDHFMDFYAWTNNGCPDMGKGENGERVGINKERIHDPYAEYFNGSWIWIKHVWTREELEAEWNAKIEAASAAQKASDIGRAVLKYSDGTAYTNTYFRLADEMGILNYRGTKFTCDYKSNALKLGDCSDLKNCIRIALTGGGSLVVNKDSIDGLINAISMFSPEDVESILRALQKERMKQKALNEKEEKIASELFGE